MKKQNIIIILVFCAVILFPGLAVWLTPDREFSENENRYLQKLPVPNADTVQSGDFGDEVEDYLSDQFWLRDRWTALRSRVKMLLGNKDIGGVYLCRDGYYIEKVTQNDLDEGRLRKNLQTVREFFDRCVELGLEADDLTFLPVPTPGYILKDKLPRYAVLFDEDAVFAEMGAAMDGYRLVDLREPFAAACADEQLYYRTDHHWTTMGAYLAYDCIMQGNGAYEGELQKVSNSFLGTTYSKTLDSAAVPDEVYIAPVSDSLAVTADGKNIEVYDMSKLDTKDKYTVFFGGNRAMMLIKGGAQNGKTLLVIKDSFANSLVPFLTADYENILMLDLRYFNGSVKNLVSSSGVTDIMFVGEMSNVAKDENLFKLLF